MKTTQVDTIRMHLNRTGAITAADAWGLYGCARLAARIKELRDEYGAGAIVTDRVTFTHAHTGAPGSCARYMVAREHRLG